MRAVFYWEIWKEKNWKKNFVRRLEFDAHFVFDSFEVHSFEEIVHFYRRHFVGRVARLIVDAFINNSFCNLKLSLKKIYLWKSTCASWSSPIFEPTICLSVLRTSSIEIWPFPSLSNTSNINLALWYAEFKSFSSVSGRVGWKWARTKQNRSKEQFCGPSGGKNKSIIRSARGLRAKAGMPDRSSRDR